MRLLILCISFLSIQGVNGQDKPSISLFDSLYAVKGEIKIILTYPFDSLYRAQQNDIEASISIQAADHFFLKDTPMNINLRGKFRRMKCTMPPLMLNFKKSTLRELGLNTVDEIKLVTHCMETEEGQENLQEERFCYQLYESLTPYAYRTIWTTVEYHDASTPGKVTYSTGFLLEPDRDLSSRLNLKEKRVYNIAEDSLHFESYCTATVFNFLVGNRDWSVRGARNAKMFFDEDQNKYLVIPYDFDYANIVGASYRRETLPESMLHPYDRIFAGEYFEPRAGEMLQNFQLLEPSILGLVETVPNPLHQDRRKKIAKYLEGWFAYVKKRPVEELRFGLVCPYKGGL